MQIGLGFWASKTLLSAVEISVSLGEGSRSTGDVYGFVGHFHSFCSPVAKEVR